MFFLAATDLLSSTGLVVLYVAQAQVLQFFMWFQENASLQDVHIALLALCTGNCLNRS